MAPPVKSALRVLELLEFFAEERRPSAVGEIAQSLGWPQSSTSVLLHSLVEAGYVDQDRRTGLFMPSVRITLATAWMQDYLYSEHNLLRLMERVRDQSGHTVMIGVRRGVQVRYMHVLQATREGRFLAKIGSLRPLFGSAAGRMLLTTLPQRDIGMLLRKAQAMALAADHPRALELDFDSVCREVERARREGFAESTGTSMPGAAALAVLIPVGRDRAPMTLSVGGPTQEVAREREHLLALLRAAVEPLRRTLVAGTG